jgi:hypothetical protein
MSNSPPNPLQDMINFLLDEPLQEPLQFSQQVPFSSPTPDQTISVPSPESDKLAEMSREIEVLKQQISSLQQHQQNQRQLVTKEDVCYCFFFVFLFFCFFVFLFFFFLFFVCFKLDL